MCEDERARLVGMIESQDQLILRLRNSIEWMKNRIAVIDTGVDIGDEVTVLEDDHGQNRPLIRSRYRISEMHDGQYYGRKYCSSGYLGHHECRRVNINLVDIRSGRTKVFKKGKEHE